MVSTYEVFTNNGPRSPMPPTPFNKPSARKSLCLFTNKLDVKNKNAIRQFGASKSKHKAMKSGTTPWSLNPKKTVNSRINDQINNYLYNWIKNHPQVVQSSIFNYCLKVNIDGHTRPKMFQTFYCGHPSEIFITALLVTQKMVDSKSKYAQRII